MSEPTTITLSWNPQQYAEGVKVFRKDNGGDWIQLSDTQDTGTFEDEVPGDGTYQYRIDRYCGPDLVSGIEYTANVLCPKEHLVVIGEGYDIGVVSQESHIYAGLFSSGNIKIGSNLFS